MKMYGSVSASRTHRKLTFSNLSCLLESRLKRPE